MGKTTVSSSTFSNVAKSSYKPKLKSTKFKFKSPFQKQKAEKVEQLKGIETTNIAATLGETNRILVEIQQQLALDFANRITEKKQLLELSRRTALKQKAVKKENFVEKGRNIAKGVLAPFEKVIAPAKSIFDKLIEFVTVIGGGILFNNIWDWLSDPENRKKVKDVFDFISNNLGTIIGVIVGIKLVGVVKKILGTVKFIKKIVDFLRGPRGPRGRGPGGGTQGPRKPGGGWDPSWCGPALQCVLQKSAEVAKSVVESLVAAPSVLIPLIPILFGLPDFQTALNKKIKEKGGPVIAQAPTTAAGTPEPAAASEPLSAAKPASPYTTPSGYTYKPIFGEGGSIFNHPMLDPEFYAKEFNLLNPESSLSRYGPMVTGMGGGFGTTTMGSVMNAGSRFGMLQRFPFLSRIPGFAPRSAMRPQSPLPPRSPLTSAARVSKTGADELVEQMVNKLMKEDKIPKDIARQIVEDTLERTLKGSTRTGADVLRDLAQGGRLSSNIDDIDDVIQMLEQVAKQTAKRSKGGTIFGSGSQSVDSVPAMLAPGEEVIRASAANQFRPLLKDINDNSGRMFVALSNAITTQTKNNRVQEETNNKFTTLIEDFNDQLESLIRKQQKKDYESLYEQYRTGQLMGGPKRPTTSQSLKVSAKPKTTPKTIQTYRRSGGSGSRNGQPTIVNMPMPAMNLAGNQAPEAPNTNVHEPSTAPISISSFDSSNPYIAESLADYGIFV